MRKNLIGTILVLAALAACNKEVETPAPAVDNGQEEVTPGKVTLTFKATIDEGTRTSYDAELNGSWVADDAITVRITNGTEYETADFTTTDGETFSGQVPEGYTTIVSGVYPANENHVFSNGSVQSVYLPDTYDLGTANDGGIALPMVGEMVDDVFTFHHICGALKIEIVDIFNTLTFTTAGEKITGSFSLNSDGRIDFSSTNGDGRTVTFNYDRLQSYIDNGESGQRDSRTFFIPVPVETLDAGATMALKNDADEIVYQKSTSKSMAFSSNIRRLSPIEFTEASDWSIVLDQSGAKVKVIFNVPDNQTYFRALLRKDQFENTYNSSVENWVEQKVTNTGTNKTLTGSDTYSTGKTIGEYYDGPSDDFDHTYVYLMCSAVVNPSTNRQFDFVYKKTEVILEDPATTEYFAWLGDWQVTENTGDSPFTDTWNISRKGTNSTYTVTGLCKRTTWEIVANYDSDGSLLIKAQKNIATTSYEADDGNTYAVTVNLYGKKTDGKVYSGTYSLMRATIDNTNSHSATLSPPSETSEYVSYLFSGNYTLSDGTNKSLTWRNGTRSNSATMTKQ